MSLVKGSSEPLSPREPVSSMVNLVKDDARILRESPKKCRLLSNLLIGNDEP